MGIAACPCKREAKEAEVPCHHSIMDEFMVYKDRMKQIIAAICALRNIKMMFTLLFLKSTLLINKNKRN